MVAVQESGGVKVLVRGRGGIDVAQATVTVGVVMAGCVA